MNSQISITTDTATLSIFDLASLKHRFDDTPDWWSIEEDEIEEINQGNVIFLNLGADGQYLIEVCETLHGAEFLYLKVPSGRVFVGAGEDTTGGELQPDMSDYSSGKILELPKGNYQVFFAKNGNTIQISFVKSSKGENHLENPIRI